ncbi:hypothetical protein HD806DRAFT_277563 [Xylariaceae sp. AK1471]|nr:hypothetical protein HD806DRAFT_277563 [Xylariaceae sp. AK1471]
MRRHITTLVLTTSTLVSTDAIQLRTPTVDEGSTLLRREADLTPGLKNLEGRTWVSRPRLELEYVKRHDDKKPKTEKGGGDDQYGDRPGDGGDDPDTDDDDDDDDDSSSTTPPAQMPTSKPPPMPTTPLTTSIPQGDPYQTTTPISSMSISASSSVASTSFTPSPSPTGTHTGSTSSSSFLSSTSTTNTTPLLSPSPSLSTTNQNGGIGNSNHHDDDIPPPSASQEAHNNNSNSAKIAGGVVGGLLLLFLLLFLWYWLVMRPKRRERLKGGENMALANDTDPESHVTVDLRNGPHTPPLDGRSSRGGDGSSLSSGNAMSSVPVPAPFAVAAAHHLSAVPASYSPSPYQAHSAEPYSASQRSPEASSPATSHHSFMDGYEAVYGQAHPLAYSPLGNSQGNSMSISALPPSQRAAHDRPSPLQISKHPNPAMELDGRPPPPRYPDAIAATSPPHPNASPTSPLPVSPLSVISPTLLMSESHFHHPQQGLGPGSGPGPRQPNYEAYEASTLPEVVSPMYQLGQVSASPPEYDESAETAQQNNNNNNNSHNDDDFAHHGDEKQALSSQQPMPRY